jgi:transposase
VVRWVIERFFSWLHRFRKLRLRTEETLQSHDALLKLASALVCLNFVTGQAFG